MDARCVLCWPDPALPCTDRTPNDLSDPVRPTSFFTTRSNNRSAPPASDASARFGTFASLSSSASPVITAAVGLAFWTTMATLLSLIEARMLHTFDMIASWSLTNSLAGLILPVLPFALGTSYLRKDFRPSPRDVFDAAHLDGVGPMKCNCRKLLCPQ